MTQVDNELARKCWNDVLEFGGGIAIEMQFPGYELLRYTLPFSDSPFEHIDDANVASNIAWNTLMGDADDRGWICGEARGEDFQVRRRED